MTLINDLNNLMQHILSKFTDDNKRGQKTDTLKSSSIFQKGLSGLEKWTDRDFMQVKGNCQVLHVGQSKSVQQHRTGATWKESSPDENYGEILANIKLNTTESVSLLERHPVAY